MKALVTGAGGQLSTELLDRIPAGWEVTGLSEIELDICDATAVRAAVERIGPDVVINAAAYTAVDRAESQSETAWRVNRDGTAVLAEACRAAGARFAHVSTDFVFDGSLGRPWRPDDPTGPLQVYGASKLAGEQAALQAVPNALIVRTAWVYSPHGGNFVKTMLRLLAERGEVRVVADQIGTPTAAASLADALFGLISAGAAGTHHFTDAGAASWYDFAHAIAEDGVSLGMLGPRVSVSPIATADYPTPAARPAFSVLDKTSAWSLLGAPSAHWRLPLRETLARLQSAG